VILLDERDDVFLFCRQVLVHGREELADGVGQGVARVSRRAVPPCLPCLCHLQQAVADGVVLALHDIDERRAVRWAAFPQPRPDVLVFSGVAVIQDAAHHRDVVGDQRAALFVPGRHGPDQAGHQPELAAE
jgi:hypothetical protein